MKKLGFGLMRLPLLDANDPKSIDLEQTKRMVDSFLAQGFTYFDTAWMYHSFASEKAVKEVLTSRHPRESYTLATKLHIAFVKSPEDRDRIFQTQLENTGVTYFDYYLLHDMGVEHYKLYQKFDCFSWLCEKKQQGLVKHIGFSFHDSPELLDRILTEHPEIEFVQLQINYIDWDSPAIRARECYEIATRHKKPVIVMEPVKGGTLAALPESVAALFRAHNPEMSVSSWAIRFAASLENVMVVLSGMSNMEQLTDNTHYMAHFQPLDTTEQTMIRKAVDAINASIAIPCTGCSYCTDGCPQNICIPKYFNLYNADLQEIKTKSWTPQEEYYLNLTRVFGKPDSCVECGQCESVCPQHLPIIAHLKTVAQYFNEKA